MNSGQNDASEQHDTPEQREKYRERMQRRKIKMEARIAKANIDRGVFVVNTGGGKGKSSSGFGMLARSLGHGFRCGVVQFIKGRQDTAEERFFRQAGGDLLDFHICGEGFTWITQDRERDQQAVLAGWEIACKMLADPNYDFILLDELNIALKHQYLSVDEVLRAVSLRPPKQHVVITGRHAPDALIAAADTVTEMRVIKHAMKAGIKAQNGIEL
ncbi:Cob(I)alamin adenosyltransferase [gamma proteobacterium HdN1]|nr:Cob(I)alamin adenosyltransferase [gamma proteobacterium HdN1]